MVAATYCPEPRERPQALVSVEDLRGHFRDAETELYRSKGFRKILEGLKQSGVLTSETQALMKAMCREAIRSTLRQVCCLEPMPVHLETPAPVAPVDSKETERSPQRSAVREGLVVSTPVSLNIVQAEDVAPEPASESASVDAAPTPFLSAEDLNLEANLDQAVHPITQADDTHNQPAPAISVSVVADVETQPETVENVAEDDDQATVDARSDRPDLSAINPAHWWSALRQPKPCAPSPEELRQSQLQAIGKTLQDARLAQNMPLEALHQRTLIARHQLRAIEAGGGQWLPEDIYLKGFIQRMGTVLGLDGVGLANQLTPLPTPESARPSWYSQSPAIAASRVDPTQLYIGYAAVVAGSVWGLSWVSQHPIDVSQIPALQSALGVQSSEAQPLVALEGLKFAPKATVDTNGAVKIQFSNRPARSPLAPERAAMEAVDR